jgi:peptidoglycan/LPS O-acetylase OafA/YrhL
VAWPTRELLSASCSPNSSGVAIAVISIVICIRGEYWHPSVTFYLMPARAWELMFGALAAGSAPLRFTSPLAIEGAAYAGLAVVLSSFFLFDEGTGFPNPCVLIPCAATAWLLFMGRPIQHTPPIRRPAADL